MVSVDQDRWAISEARPLPAPCILPRFLQSRAADGESVIGGGVMAVDQNNGQVDQPVPDSYENLLDDYSHFAPPAADEVLQGTVLSITAKDVIIDFGYKSEGIVPIEQFQGPGGEVTVQAGRRGRRDDRPRRALRRIRAALPHARRAPARLGQPGKGLSGAAGHLRPRAGPRQRRPGGGRRHQGVHARIAGRSASGAQPGCAGRPGYAGQDRQAQPAPRQRGGLAQDWRSRKRSTRARASRWNIWRRARWSPAWSRI